MGLKPRYVVIPASAMAGGALFLGIAYAAKAGKGGKIILTTLGLAVGAGVGMVLSAT